ncbi:MAG: hypothetical protein JWN04_1999 [Myxococcaceae bacterium]|nr:hypothetical protein [Myxococcaceae bacterium]
MSYVHSMSTTLIGLGVLIAAVIALAVVAEHWEELQQRFKGRSLPIWATGSRVLEVEQDAQGYVSTLVYCGDRGGRGSRRWWLRRWERERGVVWQLDYTPGASSIVARDGRLVFIDQKGKLTSIETKTATVVWSINTPGSIKQGPSLNSDHLLYLFETGEWRRIRWSDGQTIEQGTLARTSDREALFETSAPTPEDESHSYYLEPKLPVLLQLSGAPDLVGRQMARVGCDEVAFNSRALTLSLCDAGLVREGSRDRDIPIAFHPLHDAPALAHPGDWLQPLLLLGSGEPALNRIDWFGSVCALTTSYLYLPQQRNAVSGFWLVDFTTRRVLMRNVEGAESWLETPAGRQSICL